MLARTGLSRSSVYAMIAMIAKGAFVTPVKLSTRAIGFLSAEVDEWIAGRAAQRKGH